MALEDVVCRLDLVALLASMGVKLACDNASSLEELEQRLDQTLDISQNGPDLINDGVIDPENLPRWAADKPVLRSSARTTTPGTPNGSTPRPQKAGLLKKTETLKEMRQTLEFVAYACHAQCRDLVLITSDLKKGVYIKILAVHDIGSNTPMFFIIYRELISTLQTPMTDLLEKLPAGKEKRPQVTVSDLENYAFLKLLGLNAARLDPKHQALIDAKGGKRFHLRASFLLPLAPPAARHVLELSDKRCNSCGKRRDCVQLCQVCLTAAYCGRSCRSKDFHKLACAVLKDASWTSATLVNVSKRNSIFLPETVRKIYAKNNDQGLNHDGRITLAQFNATSVRQRNRCTSFVVCDRQGFFTAEWMLDEPNRKVFEEALKQGGNRFYRWVRHISGTEYDICFEKEPKVNLHW